MKQSRHQNYQNFTNKKIKNVHNDKIRFDWIKKIVKSNYKIKTVTDIGSNLGYFCINFNNHFDTNSIGYEYEKPTFIKACNIRDKMNIPKTKCKYINKGITLNNITKIKKTDLLIHLSVLHHAGHMYDRKLIKNKNDWKKYSIKYLRKFSKISKYMFFQTGNVNYNKNYFENYETFKILPFILKEAGWKITKIGNIDFSKKKIQYKTFNPNSISKVPIVTCERNTKTNKVIYKKGVNYYLNMRLVFFKDHYSGALHKCF